MQRTLLIALATAVVAAGIATTATVLLTADDEDNAALVSPSPSVSPVESAASESASPSPSGSAEVTDGAASPAASPGDTDAPATTKPGVKIRSAESVDCETEAAFCSSTDEMIIVADRELDGLSEASDPKSTTRPTVAMDSVAWDSDKDEISNGDKISSLHVDIVVSNSSKSTFVFAKREIVLEIFRNGKRYDSFSTNGSGFEMTPGSKMTGAFDRPITEDGTYEWRAKVWYYKK